MNCSVNNPGNQTTSANYGLIILNEQSELFSAPCQPQEIVPPPAPDFPCNQSTSLTVNGGPDSVQLLNLDTVPINIKGKSGNKKCKRGSLPTCNICFEEFGCLAKFKCHQRKCRHKKLLSCDKCGEEFNKPENMILHEKMHTMCLNDMKCPLCDKEMTRLASFKCHLALHIIQDTADCHVCNTSFTYATELNNHLTTEHNVDALKLKTAASFCVQCGQIFQSKSELSDHMESHKKKNRSLKLTRKAKKSSVRKAAQIRICAVCGKHFNKTSALKRHEIIHTGLKPFTCGICGKGFNQKGALQFHETTHLEVKPYKCELCGVRFSQRGNLRTHSKRTHQFTLTENTNLYGCPFCTCVFKKAQSLQVHMNKRHVGLIDSKGAQKVVSGLSPSGLFTTDVLDVTNQQPQPITPQLANNQLAALPFDDWTEERVNFVAFDEQPVKDTPVISTIKRAATGTATATYRRPYTGDSFVGSKLRDVRIIRNEKGDPLWCCPYCDFKLSRGSDLVRHVRKHTKEKPYPCSMCGKCFSLKSSLLVHLRGHLNISAARCPVCLKHLSTNAALRKHMLLHNNQRQPMACCICSTTFNSSARLLRHMTSCRKKALDKEKSLRPAAMEPVMESCTGQFVAATIENQTVERRIQSGKADATDQFAPEPVRLRSHRCRNCPASFYRAQHLRAHLHAAHSGNRQPYYCKQCDRTFMSERNLKDHIKRHNGRRSHLCPYCPKSFVSSGTLRRHTFVHTNVKPFFCPFCQLRFKRATQCRGHISRKHQTQKLPPLSELVSSQWPKTSQQLAYEQDLNNDWQSANVSGYDPFLQSTNYEQVDNITNPEYWTENENTSLFDNTPAAQLNEAELNSVLNDGSVLADVMAAVSLLGLSPTNVDHRVPMDNEEQISAEVHYCHYCNLTVMNAKELNEHMSVCLNIPQAPPQQYDQPQGSSIQYASQAPPAQFSTHAPPAQFNTQAPTTQYDTQAPPAHYNTHTPPAQYNAQAPPAQYNTQAPPPQFDAHAPPSQYITQAPPAQYDAQAPPAQYDAQAPPIQYDREAPTNSYPPPTQYATVAENQCTSCFAIFDTRESLSMHMREIHGVNSTVYGHDSVSNDTRQQNEQITQCYLPPPIQINQSQTLVHNQQVVDASASLTVYSHPNAQTVEKGKGAKLKVTHQATCNYCMRQFKKPSDLVRHIRVHTGERPFPCSLCGTSYRTKSTLTSHMKTHSTQPSHEPLICQACRKPFMSRGALKVHMRIHTNEEPFSCDICEMTFRTSGMKLKHINKEHREKELGEGVVSKNKKKAKGLQVGRANPKRKPSIVPELLTTVGTGPSAFTPFTNKVLVTNQPKQPSNRLAISFKLNQDKSLQAEIRAIVGDTIVAGEDYVLDTEYLKEIVNEGLMLNLPVNNIPEYHGPNHLELDPTQILEAYNSALKVTASTSEHIHSASERILSASEHMEASEHMGSTSEHQQSVSEFVQGGGTESNLQQQIFIRECQVCEVTFGNAQESESHFTCSTDHETAMLSARGAHSTKNRPFGCTYCIKAFESRSKLDRHMRLHNLNRPFTCPQCYSTFSQKSAMNNHVDAVHKQIKRHQCGVCGQCFPQKYNLTRHLQKHQSSFNDPVVRVQSRWSPNTSNANSYLLKL